MANNVAIIVYDLYRDQCVRNKGLISVTLDAPTLGKGVSHGVGAKVIGKIKIAGNVRVSSMSLVNKEFNEKDA